VGKLGVPDRILLKPGALDEEELIIMRSHATVGARILANSSHPVIQMGERIALSHHERWDGGGYPAGLKGADIPYEGRICAVVDVFDALTMDRPYRKSLHQDQALSMMRAEVGRHFDPDVFETFVETLPQIMDIRQTMQVN
jgi:putative two-component system response regulator